MHLFYHLKLITNTKAQWDYLDGYENEKWGILVIPNSHPYFILFSQSRENLHLQGEQVRMIPAL